MFLLYSCWPLPKEWILYLAVNRVSWSSSSFLLSASQVYSFRSSQGKLIFCDHRSSSYQIRMSQSCGVFTVKEISLSVSDRHSQAYLWGLDKVLWTGPYAWWIVEGAVNDNSVFPLTCVSEDGRGGCCTQEHLQLTSEGKFILSPGTTVKPRQEVTNTGAKPTE